MNLSPMMQQYQQAKASCPDALLLFRMGDFYELFHEDARTAATILNLTLTSRDKGENPVPMAGFPYHQLESYLAKLIARGLRVAVCEQVEDPAAAKGIVQREVVRIVTPGTLTDDALLDPRANNYLAAVAPGKNDQLAGVAWVELSTGRFWAGQCPAAKLADELARIDPVECLWPEGLPCPFATSADPGPGKMAITTRPGWIFSLASAKEALLQQFGIHTLEGFGFGEETDQPAICAAGAVMLYLRETQKATLPQLDRLIRHQPGQTLEIDEATRRSLELTRTLRDGRREGTLLAILDRTQNPMGARLLAEWVAAPLTEVAAIEQRLNAVAELRGDPRLRDAVRADLQELKDLERLLARVATGRCTPRDVGGIAKALSLLPGVKARLSERAAPLLNELESAIQLFPELRSRLESALVDPAPLALKEGGIIQPGFSVKLDQLRDLASGGKQWIANFQAAETARTGIPSLKVGFNKVFGYFIEITNTHAQKIPANYIRKQTVKNAERYITPELKEYEERVLTAEDQAQQLEYELFCQLRDDVAGQAGLLRSTAGALAQLDALAALADLACARNYCRPRIVAEPVLEISAGRHPVVDALAAAGTYVPNDVSCGGNEGRILLITGPNMAGKSTYIRQVALMTLLAQIGSFVPAKSATIGVADRIFARVGASDELARGQSTFMVEMTETARILNTATPRSLVILDEIGRGTSTYDGVSLAWAVTEYLHDRVGCRTLFATHYHELTDLAKTLSGVKNLNVAVREWREQVVFLHQIVPGAADKSYGIHVARLAGIPPEVNNRAKEILEQLESQHLDGKPASQRRVIQGKNKRSGEWQMLLFEAPEHPVLEELRKLSVNDLTPLQALKLLEEWKGRV
ncbi:MAG: DNA mismatch repair protein MutS [Pirellulales bacterium]|nr:DNA mismatch repair protein MutS [Pirellulales bacterium]